MPALPAGAANRESLRVFGRPYGCRRPFSGAQCRPR